MPFSIKQFKNDGSLAVLRAMLHTSDIPAIFRTVASGVLGVIETSKQRKPLSSYRMKNTLALITYEKIGL